MLILAASCAKIEEPVKVPEPDWHEGATVYGYVLAGDKPISGVAVSDGVEVVVTDDEGKYAFKSAKEAGYVFVSVPSGYEAVRDGVLPEFFQRCKKRSFQPEQIDFELKEVDQRRYKMLFFGDIHLADRKFTKDISQFREFAAEVSALAASSDVPVYALTLGDMTWNTFWESNSYGLSEYVQELQKDFSGLSVFHTMGNHDNDLSIVGDLYASGPYVKLLCPTYYSFNIGGVHYIVLDSMIYNNNPAGSASFSATVTREQLKWLEKDLALVDKTAPVVVTMHTPLYRKNGDSALGDLWSLVSKFEGFDRVQFFTGHMHVVYNVDMLRRSVHVFECNSGAVCGGWWMTDTACKADFNLAADGSPGGYKIMDVDGKSLSWRYKGTSCPDDYQFRTYDRNSFTLPTYEMYKKPSSANEVLINIWDWDPSWTVTVTENGRKLGSTRLVDAYDPLYISSYEVYETEHNYSISYPSSETDHIFRVKASAPDTPLDIEVTDRFGRTYKQHMERPKAFPDFE